MSDHDEFDDLELLGSNDAEPSPVPRITSATVRHIALGMVACSMIGDLSADFRKERMLLVDALGLDARKIDRMPISRQLKILASARTKTAGAFRKGLARAIRRLSSVSPRLGLCQRSVELLYMTYLIRKESSLELAAAMVRTKHRHDVYAHLSRILGGEPVRWRALLTGSAPLVRSALFRRSASPMDCDMGDFANSFVDLSDVFESTKPAATCLVDNAVREFRGGEFSVDGFLHLGVDLPILRGLLRGEHRAQILLAGPPGVGKTQLAHALAVDAGRTLFEVRSDDSYGDPIIGNHRFNYYVLAQRLLTDPGKSLLLFDEADDVFPGEHWEHRDSSGPRSKGCTNQVLESATIPTLWITNSIESIDPAYLRRFDHVVQMDVPPRSVRRALLESRLAPLGISAALLDQAADSECLSPADIGRAEKVLSALPDSDRSPDDLARCLLSARPDSIPRGQLKAKGAATQIPYRLDWINCDAAVALIIDGLRRRGHGTLGFFGPPGTGKTELARHIARGLDRPLHLKRASDLLDSYVGGTERNIARAFEEAMQDNAVLLLDEADSFLQDRARASRSWEVTQVNELLSQLDGYNGIAILASNFVDNLDAALMRRIEAKLRFDYLRPRDATALFREVLGHTGDADTPTTDLPSRELSFGDFAAALRRLELAGQVRDARTLSQALDAEASHRKGAERAIGFLRCAA